MSATEFITKHTRPITPLLIHGLVWVAGPMLAYLEVEMQRLSEKGVIVPLDYWRAFAHMGVVGLLALGGFISATYSDWKQQRQHDKEK